MGTLSVLAWYFTVGCVAGLCGGVLGIGGGLIVVPALATLFALQHIAESLVMPLALGTSLASIAFTSISSMRAHHARRAVDWTLVRQMVPGLICGAILGAMSSGWFSTGVLKVLFLAFAVTATTLMLRAEQPQATRRLPGPAPLFATGSAIAGISTLVGCGGASMAVPFMTRCAVPMRSAIGSASAFGLPVALAGTAVYIFNGWHTAGLPPLSLGFVHMPALLAIAAGSALYVPLGAALSHRMPVASLKKCFAIVIYAVAAKMLSGM
jgi:uncharacterized membrane protein YfcA